MACGMCVHVWGGKQTRRPHSLRRENFNEIPPNSPESNFKPKMNGRLHVFRTESANRLAESGIPFSSARYEIIVIKINDNRQPQSILSTIRWDKAGNVRGRWPSSNRLFVFRSNVLPATRLFAPIWLLRPYRRHIKRNECISNWINI